MKPAGHFCVQVTQKDLNTEKFQYKLLAARTEIAQAQTDYGRLNLLDFTLDMSYQSIVVLKKMLMPCFLAKNEYKT